MEFLRVWKGLSPGQRGYLAGPLFFVWFGPIFAICDWGDPTGDATQALWTGPACAVIAFILYMSVRKKALAAEAEGTEMDVDMHWTMGMRPIPQLPGSPTFLVVAIGAVGAFSAFLVLGTQGGWAGLGVLAVAAAITAYVHSCSQRLAGADGR